MPKKTKDTRRKAQTAHLGQKQKLLRGKTIMGFADQLRDAPIAKEQEDKIRQEKNWSLLITKLYQYMQKICMNTAQTGIRSCNVYSSTFLSTLHDWSYDDFSLEETWLYEIKDRVYKTIRPGINGNSSYRSVAFSLEDAQDIISKITDLFSKEGLCVECSTSKATIYRAETKFVEYSLGEKLLSGLINSDFSDGRYRDSLIPDGEIITNIHFSLSW